VFLVFSGVYRPNPRWDLRFLSGSEVRHLRAEKFLPRVLALFREVQKASFSAHLPRNPTYRELARRCRGGLQVIKGFLNIFPTLRLASMVRR